MTQKETLYHEILLFRNTKRSKYHKIFLENIARIHYKLFPYYRPLYKIRMTAHMNQALLFEETSDSQPLLIDGADKESLLSLFHRILPAVADLMANAQQEPLYFNAHSCLEAFQCAAAQLADNGHLPYFSGNNPSDAGKGGALTQLSLAIVNTFGMTTNPSYKTYSPRSFDALIQMQPLSVKLQELAIFS